METNKIGQKVVDIIKNKKIRPIGRWQFVLKDVFMWALGALALVFSALAFSVMLFLLNNIDLSLSTYIKVSTWHLLLNTLPYFWIFFVSILIFIIYFQVRHTKKGYRYPLWLIVTASILGSAFLGSGFAVAGLGEKLDEALSYQAPFYQEVINPQMSFWSSPQNGRLLGMVTGVGEGTDVTLIDNNGKLWKVYLDPAKNAVFIEEYRPARFLGKQVSENEFVAEKVLPFAPGKRMFQRINQKNTPNTPPSFENSMPLGRGLHR
jgi:hypothetical protein